MAPCACTMRAPAGCSEPRAVPVGSFNVTTGGGRVATPSLERGSIVILDRAGRVLHERHVAASSHDACWIAV